MCRGYQPNERERLSIKGFYLHLAFNFRRKALPDSLTLHFLPRINGSFLEINGSSVRPDTPSFITMHRILSAEKLIPKHGAVYGSGEKLKASEGSRFEIYLADVKLLKGFIRKGERENWELECKCLLEEGELEFLREIDICLAVEGGENISMNKKVEKRRRKVRDFRGLEEIPEEREREEEEEEEIESRCYCDECSGCCGGSDGDDDDDSVISTEGGDCDLEVLQDTEGVNWAVDVGIWVVCLGFGYLVTKASSKRLRFTRLLF